MNRAVRTCGTACVLCSALIAGGVAKGEPHDAMPGVTAPVGTALGGMASGGTASGGTGPVGTAQGGASPEMDSVLQETLKGNAQLRDAPSYPSSYLSLLPPQRTPGSTALQTPHCGPRLSSAAIVIGPRDQFAKAKSAGMGLLSTIASAATGGKLSGAPGQGNPKQKSPPLFDDPIKRTYRKAVKDKPTGIKLDLGGQLTRDAMLLSTRLDSVDGKGTVQEIYLERDDCRRIYPIADYTYELWGSWSLSVSWTRTESAYQDGKLVNQTSASGGFFRSGVFGDRGGGAALAADFAKLPPDVAAAIGHYQAQILEESGVPMWQRLGFAAPTSGARTVGNLFRLSDADSEAIQNGRMAVVVQVTREHGPLYEAVGVPVTLGPGKDAHLTFASARDGNKNQ